jgi:cell division septum initiation protein DivIVA
MSFHVKMQMLLLLSSVFITVYLYYLFKELNQYQNEVRDIKTQLVSLEKRIASTTVPDASPQVCVVQDTSTQYHQVPVGDQEDDQVSVTSNEIKDILTHIEDDASLVQPEEVPKSIDEMTELELSAVKYDDLRNYLKKLGQPTKGTKVELIQRIMNQKNVQN